MLSAVLQAQKKGRGRGGAGEGRGGEEERGEGRRRGGEGRRRGGEGRRGGRGGAWTEGRRRGGDEKSGREERIQGETQEEDRLYCTLFTAPRTLAVLVACASASSSPSSC